MGSPGGPVARAYAHISAYTVGCPAFGMQLPTAAGGGGGGVKGICSQKVVMSWSPHMLL